MYEHLRPGSGGCARKSCQSSRHPLPRCARIGHQRSGAPWRRYCVDRRGSFDHGRSERCVRRVVRAPFPRRQGRRWRPRQARRQSDPRPQSSRTGRGPGLCRAARPRPRGVSRCGPRVGLLFAGDGDQGAENGARRFFRGRPSEADTERCAPDARSGSRRRAKAFSAWRACGRARGLRTCRRRADLDNSAVIKEIRRRRT